MTRVPALILTILLGAGPVLAEEQPTPQSPPDLMRESARRILEGIRRLVDQMPMFEPPRVTPEGDIILKRLRPPPLEGEEAKTREPETGGLEL